MEGTANPDSRGFGTNYLPNDSRGANDGGGTYTSSQRNPSMDDYEQIFGPSARDIKQDPMRHKRHQRWHLPDVLKGPNPYLTDRIDGLITDTTNSPFTTVILPYVYLEHPDAKIKWNVWAFDEGMASRVPYESAARVLTQTHKSFAGYTVRHGLAVTLEHNFMMSPEGRVNFQNQLKQLVGSIQYTNDYDVHVALIMAPSYASTVDEKYYARDKNVWQRCREYVDLFGIMQKNGNAMDILIEEAKATLRSWGAQEPNFLLTNSKLTMQMTMTPEQTSYITYGPDGAKRLKNGPNISNYRGLNIVNSRAFSTEEGARPRDILNRRVRVAEYYLAKGIKHGSEGFIELYDQSKDQMFKMSFQDLWDRSTLPPGDDIEGDDDDDGGGWDKPYEKGNPNAAAPDSKEKRAKWKNPVLVEEEIHHEGGSSSSTDDTGKLVVEPRDDVIKGTQVQNYKTYYALVNSKGYTWETTIEDKFTVANSQILPENMLFSKVGAFEFKSDENKSRSFSHAAASRDIFACEMTNELMQKFLTQPDSIDRSVIKTIIKPMLGISDKTAYEGFDATNSSHPEIMSSLMLCYLAYDVLRKSSTTAEISKQSLTLGNLSFSTTKLSDLYDHIERSMTSEQNNYKSLIDYMNGFMTTNSDEIRWLTQNDEYITKESWNNDSKNRNFATKLKHSLQFAFNSMHSKNPNVIFEQSAKYFNCTILDGLQFSAPGDQFDPYNIPGEGGGGDQANKTAYDKLIGQGTSKYFIKEALELRGKERPIDETFGTDERGAKWDFVIVRPNIEHNMLGVVMGRGGKDELGATFWGQTELSCYDDGMHGKWGMSYKYHERAMVLNEKNLIKCWDVAFNGYNGGMDDTYVDWKNKSPSSSFQDATTNLSEPYSGDSMIIMRFRHVPGKHWPNPILLSHEGPTGDAKADMPIDPENIHSIFDWKMGVFCAHANSEAVDQSNCFRYSRYAQNINFPDFARLHRQRKPAGYNAQESLTEATSLAFQGTSRVYGKDHIAGDECTKGAGHLGQSYVGVASVREGKGLFFNPGVGSMNKLF